MVLTNMIIKVRHITINYVWDSIFNVNIIKFISNRKKVDKKTNNYRQIATQKTKDKALSSIT
jgi:hypothetical protein